MEHIIKEDVKRRLESRELITLVDVRAPDAWSASDVQLPEAIRIAPNELDQHLQEIPRDQLVITYCSDPDEHSSVAAAQALLGAGWTDVRPLAGGFEAWKNAGYPLQAKISDMPSRLEQIDRRTSDIQENLETAEGEQEIEEP